MEHTRNELEEPLEESMGRLIQAMRHLLRNMQEEQRALMLGNPGYVESVLQMRGCIIDEMADRRLAMCSILSQFSPCTPDVTLEDLSLIVGSDKITLLMLRDQVLALTSSIELQNGSNRSLMVKRVESQRIPKKQTLAVLDP